MKLGSSQTRPGLHHAEGDRAITGREHLPNRPGWDCWACGQDWPCEPAQDAFAETYDVPSLAEFMGDLLVTAAKDLPWLEIPDLAGRFVAWTWHPPN